MWDDENVLEVDGGEKKKKTLSVKVLNSYMSPVAGPFNVNYFFQG